MRPGSTKALVLPRRALVGRLGQEGGPGRAVRSLRGGSAGCASDGDGSGREWQWGGNCSGKWGGFAVGYRDIGMPQRIRKECAEERYCCDKVLCEECSPRSASSKVFVTKISPGSGWEKVHTLLYNCYNYRGGWREYCGLVDSERRVKTRQPGGNQPPPPPGCLAYTRPQRESAVLRVGGYMGAG